MRKKVDMPIFRRKCYTYFNDLKGELSKLKLLIKIGPSEIIKKINSDERPKDVELAIVTIVKNESEYIKEWIEYHKLVGFSKFYIFDNDSTDNLDNVLDPYINDGTVVLNKILGQGKQLDAIEQGIQLAKNTSKWLAIVDVDEFIVPLNGYTISGILNSKKSNGLLIGWMIYGSNHLLKKPKGLVIENFTKHADYNFIADYKMIVNPRKVLKVIHPHWIQVLGKIRNENGKRIHQYPYVNVDWQLPASMKKIRINHYYSKSLEEFQSKAHRGFADGAQRGMRNINDFKEHDQNEVEDNVMEKYIRKLRDIDQ